MKIIIAFSVGIKLLMASSNAFAGASIACASNVPDLNSFIARSEQKYERLNQDVSTSAPAVSFYRNYGLNMDGPLLTQYCVTITIKEKK